MIWEETKICTKVLVVASSAADEVASNAADNIKTDDDGDCEEIDAKVALYAACEVASTSKSADDINS